jgi:Ca-activated chloride channel family protein
MRSLALITAVALALSFWTGGTAPLGRAFLAAGLPGVAAFFFDDPAWRGVAHYRAGRFDLAAADFAQARLDFALGNAEAHRGNYAAALEAYDRAVVAGDPRARANFDLVAAFYAGLGIDPDAFVPFPEREEGPTLESFVGEGDGRAAGTGDAATNTNTMMGLAQLDSRGNLGVRRVFDDAFMVADERWLAQLEDVPGAYLSARIAAEHKRRVAAGLAPPDAEDPR